MNDSGLGLGICIRLVDDFLREKHASDSLTIIFTTRSPRKSTATLDTLQRHLKSKHPTASRRISFQPESVDLTNLLSVRALAEKLLRSEVPQIDALVLNAGIGGWTDLNWPLAVGTVLVDWRRASTWPTFKISGVGAITQPQLPSLSGERIPEPPLGEVFCANLFGHYMLSHWLTPMLWACRPECPARIIFVSSLGGPATDFNVDDIQGFRAHAAYEQSKWATDHLVLTARDQPATQAYVKSYLDPKHALVPGVARPRSAQPVLHCVQPGILATAIIALPWILAQAYIFVIYMARWLGSPWATVAPYPAAVTAAWLALVSPEDLDARETEVGGKNIKWGSAIDRSGRARVETTDVAGWGTNGSGRSVSDNWWGGPAWWMGGQIGRPSWAQDATKENVEDFVVKSVKTWKQMEELRVEWEHRLAEHGRLPN